MYIFSYFLSQNVFLWPVFNVSPRGRLIFQSCDSPDKTKTFIGVECQCVHYIQGNSPSIVIHFLSLIMQLLKIWFFNLLFLKWSSPFYVIYLVNNCIEFFDVGIVGIYIRIKTKRVVNELLITLRTKDR